jgi:phosphate:Na+ symporter
VLGANAGGTMLPQLLSLDIGVLSAPFLAAGTLLLLMPRKFGLAPWGWVLLGAGLALAGWTLLEDAAELAAYSKRLKTEVLFGDVDYSLSFAAIVARYLAYFVLGSLAAFVLRTSNLVVVIAILLASSGIVQAVTALPLILGANLGSAAMVFVLSLRKRREAKRLALANLVVQMFGVTAAVILSLVTVSGQPVFVWLIDFLTPGKLVAALPANVESHLATAHTFYNLLAGIAFVFFPAPLFSVVDRLLPPKPVAQDVKPYLLDKNLITVPALALRQVTEETIYLTEICRKTIAEAFDSFRYNDLDLSDQVVRREEVISEMHREVSQYLVEICENQLARRDASRVGVLQTTASGLGRIGELGELLRDLAARKIEEHVASDPEVERDLNEVYDLVMAQFANILSLLRQGDTKTEENAVKMTERIAKFGSRFESQARQRIEQAGSPANPVQMHVQTLVYHEAFNTLFRVAGNLTHIAECMRILSPDRF